MITKALNRPVAILVVIFFGLLLILSYLWVTDQWNIRTRMADNSFAITNGPIQITTPTNEVVGSEVSTTSAINSSDPNDKHPYLNVGQEKALELIGLDPHKVPTKISPEQEVCIENEIGSERVAAIKAGDIPNVIEIIKAKDCVTMGYR